MLASHLGPGRANDPPVPKVGVHGSGPPPPRRTSSTPRDRDCCNALIVLLIARPVLLGLRSMEACSPMIKCRLQEDAR